MEVLGTFFSFIFGFCVVLGHRYILPLWGITTAVLVVMSGLDVASSLVGVIVLLLTFSQNPFLEKGAFDYWYRRKKNSYAFLFTVIVSLLLTWPLLASYPFSLTVVMVCLGFGGVLTDRHLVYQWDSLIVGLGGLLFWAVETRRSDICLEVGLMSVVAILLSKILMWRQGRESASHE